MFLHVTIITLTLPLAHARRTRRQGTLTKVAAPRFDATLRGQEQTISVRNRRRTRTKMAGSGWLLLQRHFSCGGPAYSSDPARPQP